MCHWVGDLTNTCIVCRLAQSPNILLSNSWVAKVADTGLSRTLFTKSHLTNQSATLGGTYNWQASLLIKLVMFFLASLRLVLTITAVSVPHI